jgi:hypothetical protein
LRSGAALVLSGLILVNFAAAAAEAPDLHLYKQGTCGGMIEGGVLAPADYLPCVTALISWKPAKKAPSEEFCKHSFSTPEVLANCTSGLLPTWTFDSSKGGATVNGSFVQ